MEGVSPSRRRLCYKVSLGLVVTVLAAVSAALAIHLYTRETDVSILPFIIIIGKFLYFIIIIIGILFP